VISGLPPPLSFRGARAFALTERGRRGICFS